MDQIRAGVGAELFDSFGIDAEGFEEIGLFGGDAGKFIVSRRDGGGGDEVVGAEDGAGGTGEVFQARRRWRGRPSRRRR